MSLDAEVRLYILKENGALEEESLSPFSYYGTCPNVGDTICKSFGGKKRSCYSVQRRYFIDNHDFKQGWVVILRELEISPQIRKVLNTWDEDEAFRTEMKAKEAAEEQAARERQLEALLNPRRLEPIQPPLNHREEAVLERLSNMRSGAEVSPSSIPKFGPQTQNDLLKRRYIELVAGGTVKGKFRLTKKGRKEWKALKDYRAKQHYL